MCRRCDQSHFPENSSVLKFLGAQQSLCGYGSHQFEPIVKVQFYRRIRTGRKTVTYVMSPKAKA